MASMSMREIVEKKYTIIIKAQHFTNGHDGQRQKAIIMAPVGQTAITMTNINKIIVYEGHIGQRNNFIKTATLGQNVT